jgi:hypothetical protein
MATPTKIIHNSLSIPACLRQVMLWYCLLHSHSSASATAAWTGTSQIDSMQLPLSVQPAHVNLQLLTPKHHSDRYHAANMAASSEVHSGTLTGTTSLGPLVRQQSRFWKTLALPKYMPLHMLLWGASGSPSLREAVRGWLDGQLWMVQLADVKKGQASLRGKPYLWRPCCPSWRASLPLHAVVALNIELQCNI